MDALATLEALRRAFDMAGDDRTIAVLVKLLLDGAPDSHQWADTGAGILVSALCNSGLAFVEAIPDADA